MTSWSVPRQSPLSKIESIFLAGQQTVPLRIVRKPNARRYVLRVKPDGWAYVTVPRGGSRQEALAFARKHEPWIERQFKRLVRLPAEQPRWRTGSEILVRGERYRLEQSAPRPGLRLGPFEMSWTSGPLESAIQSFLWQLAAKELPERVWTLARQHQLPVRRVMVRNQRSRWGSCSIRGTISLNWRLIQAPAFVSDYIILHELIHLKQMNHSPRFWRLVAEACPEFETAEAWLKNEGKDLIRDF